MKVVKEYNVNKHSTASLTITVQSTYWQLQCILEMCNVSLTTYTRH